MPKCSVRGCGHVAETLGTLRAHYTEAGHKIKKRAKREPVVAAPEPEADAEGALLTAAIDLFVNAGTDPDADSRVLRYLTERFAPAANDSEVEPD